MAPARTLVGAGTIGWRVSTCLAGAWHVDAVPWFFAGSNCARQAIEYALAGQFPPRSRNIAAVPQEAPATRTAGADPEPDGRPGAAAYAWRVILSGH